MALLIGICALLPVALLLAAAWWDVATRLIPDGISIALAALGLAVRATDGLAALGLSVATAALLFLVLVLLHARGALGGGDVKLASALALGLPPLATLDFLMATALAGGVLALLYVALGAALGRLPLPVPPLRAQASLPRRILAVEWRRIRRGGPLPYAAAIAIGGTLALVQPIGG
jgi:prepilin peptidase CpaA